MIEIVNTDDDDSQRKGPELKVPLDAAVSAQAGCVYSVFVGSGWLAWVPGYIITIMRLMMTSVVSNYLMTNDIH